MSARMHFPIKSTFLLVTVAGVALILTQSPAHAQGRVDIDLNSGWRFRLGDIPGAHEVSFDDSGWPLLDLPHTWNNLDGQDGGNDYYRGIGWYRKHYTIPTGYAGHRIFIKFEAVNKVADVYVNGTHVGQHAGGYAAFAFDITDHALIGADNVLAVKVDNSASLDIAPLSGDFTQGGGIYRSVHLLVTHNVHITPLDYGSPGVYLTPTNVSASSADLQVTAKVRNDGDTPEEVTVQTTIRDADDIVVATLASTQTMLAHSDYVFTQTTTIANPHLWNGRSDPYLYHTTVEVKLGGASVDQVEQPLGFRYFNVDPDTGFYLNGAPLDLHGVGMHEDRKDKGRAISDADRAEDIGMVMELGATFIRLTHYQHAETTYDLCDENGLIVWTEIPLVNHINDTTEFSDNAKQQLQELIRQNYNHPSVFFWGIFNEITHYAGPDPLPLVEELNQLAHDEDPTRPTTAAANADSHLTGRVTDVMAWNKYFGWYYGTPSQFHSWVNSMRPFHPYIGVSEYGAGASIYHHQENPPWPMPDGTWHPEEYQNTLHEIHWKDMETMPFLWVKSVWVGFDFSSDRRAEGDTAGVNDKGLVTHDRSVKKDSFYWYKANWSDEPVVYITSRRFTPRSYNVAEVKVYSNCDAVELLINGSSQGSQTSTDHIYTWPGITLALGDNEVRAVCTIGAEQYEDSCVWRYEEYEVESGDIQINFQTESSATPPGYLPDVGYPYGDRGNGYTYGWNADVRSNARDRDAVNSPDQRYDTLNHMQVSGTYTWQIAVENGDYAVTIVSGDPSYYDSVHRLAAEGTLVVDGIGNPWIVGSAIVTVSDRRLTISPAAGAENAKICFVHITRLDTFRWQSYDSGGSADYGVYDQDNLTPLEAGDLLQLIHIGADGQIDPPGAHVDDVLIESGHISGGTGDFLPLAPSQDHGYFDELLHYDTDEWPDGTVVYVRAWNGPSIDESTHHGESVITTLINGGEFNFPRWYTNQSNPTAVTVASFTATDYPEHVLVAWETALEINVIGFNVQRSDSPSGPFEQINTALIVAQAPGGGMGATYTYADTTASSGVNWYRLEIVQAGGSRETSAPIQVVHYAHYISLPMVFRDE